MLISLPSLAQTIGTNEWTWQGGVVSGTEAVVYGTLGTPAPGNVPWGRYQAATWTDSSGNFWMFGGTDDAPGQSGIPGKYTPDTSHFFTDLWKFFPATNEWAWMGGSALFNQSGVYGTLGSAASGNFPGSRTGAASWIDTRGRLWLFGGNGLDANGTFGMLNDLWEFDPSTNQWTWVAGSSALGANCFPGRGWSSCDEPGVYGTLGTPGAGNIPKGRNQAATWTDTHGNFWLFGGWGWDITAQARYYFNDLWEFNPSTNHWTWMGGSSDGAGSYCFGDDVLGISVCGEAGVYGTLEISAAANFPGSRSGATAWTDTSGHVWLFGGQGWDMNGNMSDLNDVWEFNPSTTQWTWMGGGSTVVGYYVEYQTGVWGALGSLASGNIPPSRWGAASWKDSNGNFWLLGGIETGWFGSSTTSAMNDLWEFNPSTNQWAWIGGDGSVDPPGVVGTLGIPSVTNVPQNRFGACSWVDSGGSLWLFGGFSYLSGAQNDRWEYRQSGNYVSAAATPIFSLASGSYTAAQSVTISDATAGATIFYTTDGSTPTISSAVYGGAIMVTANETIKAIATATNYTSSGVATAAYAMASPGATPTNTTLTVSPNPSSFAQQAILTATVTGQSGGMPTGSVTFSTGSTTLGSAPLRAGSATLDSSSLQQGTDPIIAQYSGDSTFSASTSTAMSQVVSTAAIAKNEWIWMSGSNRINQPGVYGTLGAFGAGNGPGSRINPIRWTDRSGHLWLFGGQETNPNFTETSLGVTFNGYRELNDLWEFDPSTNEWAWIGGTSFTGNTCIYVQNPVFCGQAGVYGTLGLPSARNIPGSRDSATSWTDINGKLWLFGGQGLDDRGNWSNLNDLWEFDPSTSQWVWVSGSNTAAARGEYVGQSGVYGSLGIPSPLNVPGGRSGAMSWTDSDGNLWLFGGLGFDINGNLVFLNDLWKFSPSANEWTWMSGSNSAGSKCGRSVNFNPAGCILPGIYGALAVPAAGNNPGSRFSAANWVDSGGNLWLFGGYGYDANGTLNELDDLWEFDRSSDQWIWMGGNSIAPIHGGQPGVYGTLGVPAAGNIPGARYGATNWVDGNGNFWIMGGEGSDGNQSYLYFNDMWEFNTSQNMWAWMGGSSLTSCSSTPYARCGSSGVYGSLGVPAAGNVPGGRASAAGWSDKAGNLWLFGSSGYDASGNFGHLNDLWRYQLAITVLPAAAIPTFSISPGTYTTVQTVTISDATNGAKVYYTLNGAPPTTSSTLYTSAILVSATVNLQAIAEASGYTSSAVASASYTINLPPPDFSVTSSETSLVLAGGKSASTTISVVPINGFNSTVSLACAGLPPGVSCSFSPTSVAGSTLLTVIDPTSASKLSRNSSSLFSGSALVIAFCFLGLRKRQRFQISLLIAVGVAGLSMLNGCGSKTIPSMSPVATQPVTSRVTVTATAGSLQHSTTFSLTVN